MKLWLSPNQKRIVSLIVSGKDLKQVAAKLGVTLKAVDKCKVRMHRRLKMTTPQIIYKAAKAGLICVCLVAFIGCHHPRPPKPIASVPNTEYPIRPQSVQLKFPPLTRGVVARVLAVPLQLGTVDLRWTAVTNLDVREYLVWQGTERGVYTSATSVGLNTTYTATDLEVGTRYWFNVSAVDNDGFEGRFAIEVSAIADEPTSTAQLQIFSLQPQQANNSPVAPYFNVGVPTLVTNDAGAISQSFFRLEIRQITN